MEAIVFLILLATLICLVLPLVAIARASAASRVADQFASRLRDVEAQLRDLRKAKREAVGAEAPITGSIVAPVMGSTVAADMAASTPPPLPAEIGLKPKPAENAAVLPKLAPQPSPGPGPKSQPAVSLPSIDWERFMGAKLFAWIGGLALFLGVGFFVKYSFEHNLIPPAVRVAIGFAVGLGLVVGGVALKRKENAVTAQTLCATGILILYAVTFACRSYYHFAFFGQIPTLLLMTLITVVAFLLAVRLDAIVVAILGMAGGFLTPILLSTGHDNPFGLFGYIALLDIGLLTVSRRKQWEALPILGATGTILMQIGWLAQFFVREQYFSGNKILVPMAVFLGFELLFCFAAAWGKRGSKLENVLSAAALAIGGFALASAFYFLSFTSLGQRPLLLISYGFLVDLGLLSIVFLKRNSLRPGR